ALIRMTHSSTAIEGNNLNLRQVEAVYARKKINAPVRDIYEVQNYLKALRYIEQAVKKKSTVAEKVILKIHRLVTDKTLRPDESGHYRKSAVYVVRRKWGFPEETMYTGPDAKKVRRLMADLTKWIAESEGQNINPVIVSGIVHQEIAAIHPFSDGNGRTARALATLVLYARGYDFRRLFALEDYYNKDRPKYYAAINIGKNYEERRVDFTPWLEYFVKGFKEEIDGVKTKTMTLSRRKIADRMESQIYLDPRQLKILDSLDQMKKVTVKDAVDILKVPRRTAQLELQKLKKLKLIRQVGRGPASAYVSG
ncbi:MAG: Fic family protein, partial [Candidatus Doudnabacteria bacterium]|nr:Fic family protein [Candidatus Doudnabacteria bacterium]